MPEVPSARSSTQIGVTESGQIGRDWVARDMVTVGAVWRFGLCTSRLSAALTQTRPANSCRLMPISFLHVLDCLHVRGEFGYWAGVRHAQREQR